MVSYPFQHGPKMFPTWGFGTSWPAWRASRGRRRSVVDCVYKGKKQCSTRGRDRLKACCRKLQYPYKLGKEGSRQLERQMFNHILKVLILQIFFRYGFLLYHKDPPNLLFHALELFRKILLNAPNSHTKESNVKLICACKYDLILCLHLYMRACLCKTWFHACMLKFLYAYMRDLCGCLRHRISTRGGGGGQMGLK